MKVHHVLDSLDLGGAEVLVVQLCRVQAEAGHATAVHCLYRGGPLQEALHSLRIPVHLHANGSALGLVRSLYRSFRKDRPEVVHSHNATGAIMASVGARAAGVPAVVNTRHGLVPPDRFFRRELKFWLAARACHRVVAVCRAAHENLARGPLADAEKIVTVYNAAFPALTIDQPNGPPEKRGFTLINVARLTPEKDHETLLEAFALARKLRPDLQLWLVGGGRRVESLRRLTVRLKLNDCVLFAGERRDVGRWLAAADLFILSSISEGLPVSLLEALAAGLPHLVTDVGGMPEVSQLSRAGRVVPAGQPREMAQAILDFAADLDGTSALSALAKQAYAEHFSPGRMASEYLAIYQSCLDANAR